MSPEPEAPAIEALDARGGVTRTRGVLARLLLLSVAVLLLGQIVVVWFALSGFERELEPQLTQKAGVVGRAVADQIRFVVDDLGIPPDELVGVEPFLDQVLSSNADIEYLLMLDSSSQVQFAQGLPPETMQQVLSGLSEAGAGTMTEVAGFIDSAFPIVTGDRVATFLHVGVSNEYVRARLSDLLYEAVTVIVVSLLVTLEFLIFFMSMRVSGPLRHIETMLTDGARGIFCNHIALKARDEIGEFVAAFNRTLRGLRQRYEDFRFDAREIEDAQIDRDIARRIQTACRQVEDRYRFTGGVELWPRSAMHIRIPLFLFMFAEELPRSFLPLFVARLSPADAVLSDELLFGLPITLFMLAGAIMVPLGGGFADRYGARRVFLAGVVPAVAGYAGTFFAQGYFDLIAWRVLSGIGYGLIFISAQAWVAENTDERNRAQDMAVFVGAVFAATICGPSIGGILADRIGFEATFLISASLATVSGLIVYAMLEGSVARPASLQPTFRRDEWRALVSDARLFAVCVFAAVPGKLILTGFLFYLVPLYLSELGNRQSIIGWMIMLYGVSTLACMPFASRFADRTGRHASVVAVGGILAGLGCLASLFESSIGATSAVMIAILALGVGHALSLTSQLAIVQEVADRHPGGLGPASVIGVYRVLDRVGMIVGPLVAGGLAAGFGYQYAIVGVGVIVLALMSVYAILVSLAAGRSTPDLERSQAA